MTTILTLIACVFSYFSMTEGWGLTVHSMGWVIAGYAVTIFISAIADLMAYIEK